MGTYSQRVVKCFLMYIWSFKLDLDCCGGVAVQVLFYYVWKAGVSVYVKKGWKDI